MELREQVPLSQLTTFKIGGIARYVATCSSVADIQEATNFAKEHNLPFTTIGGGSNLLVADGGYAGVVIHMQLYGLTCTDDGLVVAGAGVVWDDVVREAGARGLWGIENLAGIPGTTGASPVQNIGAYGAELADTLVYVDVFDTASGATLRLTKEECALGYRESRFKQEPNLLITSVALQLSRDGTPRVAYKDLAARIEKGDVLNSPISIAEAVRAVRANKFPDLQTHGTGGSFFKNPVITEEAFIKLQSKYEGIPGFPTAEGVKVPLAWILDNVLHLRGYKLGRASLFERQPLVLVTEEGATAEDVDALALDVAQKVFAATKINIEREVRTLA